jgi:flagella basal body P-ring formation protein FlgA
MTMIRNLLISVAFLAAATPALAGQAVTLKARPAAGAQTVTLGDLFDGAGAAAARVVIAPAPAPGTNVVLDAGVVTMAARSAGLDWENPNGMRRIVVVGAAAATAPAAAATAAVAAPAVKREPVLTYTRNIAAGDIVEASDLVWSDDAVAAQGSIGDPARAIGMAAKQPLRAGAAALSRDLSAPMVIKRDDMITVAFESGGISLSLQGKAMKDAAAGDSLQVLNMQSKKVIEAVVVGPGRAVVGPAAQAMKARAFTTASLR